MVSSARLNKYLFDVGRWWGSVVGIAYVGGGGGRGGARLVPLHFASELLLLFHRNTILATLEHVVNLPWNAHSFEINLTFSKSAYIILHPLQLTNFRI